MQTDIRIRLAASEDAEHLAEAGATTFHETFHESHNPADLALYISSTYNPEKISENLTRPDVLYFLADDNGRAAGYIKLIRDVAIPEMPGAKVMELEKIYIRKSYQGTGLGLRLMQQAVAAAVQEKYEWLFLGVWQDNHRALAFYKKCGWEIFGTRTFQLGSQVCNDYVLRLKLA